MHGNYFHPAHVPIEASHRPQQGALSFEGVARVGVADPPHHLEALAHLHLGVAALAEVDEFIIRVHDSPRRPFGPCHPKVGGKRLGSEKT